jgi:membrane protease YdiL (CAAX protease family)
MFCRACGKKIPDQAVTCDQCGVAVAGPRQPEKYDATIRMLLPVGRSGYAIAAGYLGLFSVLLVFAPFALLCGILALKDIRKNTNKHGKGRAIFGIIMGGIFSTVLVVLLVVALLGSVGLRI